MQYGTLDVDGWAVTFGTARTAWAGPQPGQASLRCTMLQPTKQRPVYQLHRVANSHNIFRKLRLSIPNANILFYQLSITHIDSNCFYCHASKCCC